MKRLTNYLLGFALAFVLGSACLVGAQNINKALQLSQDPTGAIGVDTNNNVYFPSHILGSGIAPTVGTGCTIDSTSTDNAGLITYSSNSIGCTLTFTRAFLAVPNCVVSDQTASVVTAIGYTSATTSLAFSSLSANGLKINYMCGGRT